MRKFLAGVALVFGAVCYAGGEYPFVGDKYFTFCKSDCGAVHDMAITINKRGLVFIKGVQTHAQIMMGNDKPEIYFSGAFSNPLYIGKENDICRGDTLVFKGDKMFCTYGGKIKANSESSELY